MFKYVDPYTHIPCNALNYMQIRVSCLPDETIGTHSISLVLTCCSTYLSDTVSSRMFIADFD